MSASLYLDGGEGKPEAGFDGVDPIEGEKAYGFLRLYIDGSTVSIEKMGSASIEALGYQILNAAEAAKEHEAKSMPRVLIAEG